MKLQVTHKNIIKLIITIIVIISLISIFHYSSYQTDYIYYQNMRSKYNYNLDSAINILTQLEKGTQTSINDVTQEIYTCKSYIDQVAVITELISPHFRSTSSNKIVSLDNLSNHFRFYSRQLSEIVLQQHTNDLTNEKVMTAKIKEDLQTISNSDFFAGYHYRDNGESIANKWINTIKYLQLKPL